MNLDENTFARLIEQADADAVPRPEHQQELRKQALAAFDLAQGKPTRRVSYPNYLSDWRWIMRSPVSRIAATVIFVLAIVGVALWFHGGGATYALADFVQPIIDAKSATCKTTVEMKGMPPQTGEMMVDGPGRFRQTMPGAGVMIWDLDQGKELSLDTAKKQAVLLDIANMPKEKKEQQNLFAWLQSLLREAKEKPGMKRESLGQKKIDGRLAVGYRISNRLQTIELWGDPKTGQPIRVEWKTAMFPNMNMILSDFAFNVKLDESLFSIVPPPGYTTQTMHINAAPGTEKDLIETFRQYSELTGGVFPESLDMTGTVYGQAFKNLVGKIRAENMKKGLKEPTAQQKREIMDATVEFSRGVTFVLTLPADADAHYAGKGVSKGTPDRPIFWYKPVGSQKYRVIYADLSVREAETAPRATNAKPVAGQPGYTAPKPNPTVSLEDFIRALRTSAQSNKGMFPDKLGRNEIMMGSGAEMEKAMDKIAAKYGGKKGLREKYGRTLPPAIMTELSKAGMPFMDRVMRGVAFYESLTAANDAHYVGKGVKLDTPDRPIFWYKPTGSKKYRVVYADLSVREADTAPNGINAKPVPGQPGYTAPKPNPAVSLEVKRPWLSRPVNANSQIEGIGGRDCPVNSLAWSDVRELSNQPL